jgi:hypothetical protein
MDLRPLGGDICSGVETIPSPHAKHLDHLSVDLEQISILLRNREAHQGFSVSLLHRIFDERMRLSIEVYRTRRTSW